MHPQADDADDADDPDDADDADAGGALSLSLSLSLSIARKDAHFDFTEPLAATRCNKFVSTGRSSSPQSPQSPQPMDEEERLKRPQFRGCCAASARVYKRCSPMCWLVVIP